jgi:hemolysin D
MTHALHLKLLGFIDLLGRYGAVFGHVWKRRKLLDARKYDAQEAAFLPAALSLQETPVSPAPRVAMGLLVAFALLTLAWAVFGQIDIVATAHGKIVPGGGTKTIQSLEYAVVRKILVDDGQAVKAGEVLIELDTKSAAAELDHIREDLVSYALQEARGRAMLQSLASGHLEPLRPVPDAGPARMAQTRKLLEGQVAEYRAKVESLDAQVRKSEAELQSTNELVHKLEQTAPIARQQAEDYKQLLRDNYVSQHKYLEREQARIEQEGDLANQRSRSRELVEALRAAQSQKSALTAETRRVALDLIDDAQKKLATLKQDQIKADAHAQLMQLTSPVDGVVQQLAVHTVGGVVQPAQPLMMVVPREQTLQVEAYLENKDIGFVNAGQSAEVKVETFEYTKYGTIPATVMHVSNDAVSDEKKGLLYTMQIDLARSSIRVQDKLVNLSPGMAVTAEVKTGRRRVIEYFLSPLLQYAHESLGER